MGELLMTPEIMSFPFLIWSMTNTGVIIAGKDENSPPHRYPKESARITTAATALPLENFPENKITCYLSGHDPGINGGFIGSCIEICWQSGEWGAILIAWGSAKRRYCECIIFVWYNVN